MQSPSAPNPYLRTKILTASPEELRLMLYDGCLRFARQGKLALEEKNYEQMLHFLQRAQKILLELSTSLNPQIAPDLCSKLSALYNYCYRLLIEANTTRDVAKIDEVVDLIGYERETWQMLMEKQASAGESVVAELPALDAETPPVARAAQTYGSLTGARQTAISSLSQSA